MAIARYVFKAKAGIALIFWSRLPPNWNCLIQQKNGSDLRTVARQPLQVEVQVLLHPRRNELNTQVLFGISLQFAINILASIAFYDLLIRQTFSPELNDVIKSSKPFVIMAQLKLAKVDKTTTIASKESN